MNCRRRKDVSALDLLLADSPNQESQLIEQETEQALSAATARALKKLDPRERFIVTKRYMDDSPWTLRNSEIISGRAESGFASSKSAH